MRRLIGVLILLALCVVGFGFYRGWFSLSSSGSDPADNKVDVKLTVDRDKVKADTGLSKTK